MVETMCRLNGT